MTAVHFLNDGTRTKAFLIDGQQVTIETTEFGKPATFAEVSLDRGREMYRVGLHLGWTEGCAVRRMTTQAEVDSYIASRYDMESDNGPEAALAESEEAFYALKEDGFYEVAI